MLQPYKQQFNKKQEAREDIADIAKSQTSSLGAFRLKSEKGSRKVEEYCKEYGISVDDLKESYYSSMMDDPEDTAKLLLDYMFAYDDDSELRGFVEIYGSHLMENPPE